VTRDDQLAAKVARLANFGLDNGIVEEVGFNAKLAEWPAATALAVLDGFDRVVTARRERAEALLGALEPLGFTAQAGCRGGVWQFVSLAAPSPTVRTDALTKARSNGIELRSYFHRPLHTMPAFAGRAVAGRLSCTEDLAGRILSLPMANDLSDGDIDSIVSSLSSSLTRL
jgi:dTDP-4-amino-4,6-dideoxygalactose transaminase